MTRCWTPLHNRILFLIALLLALIYLFPLYCMYVTSLKAGSDIFAVTPQLLPQDPQWSMYDEVWATTNIPRYLWNSLIIASGATAITAIYGAGVAYALARYRDGWKDITFFTILMLQTDAATQPDGDAGLRLCCLVRPARLSAPCHLATLPPCHLAIAARTMPFFVILRLQP